VAKKKKAEKPKEYTRRQLSQHKKQKRRQRLIFIGGISVIVAIVLIILVGWFVNEYRPLHRTAIKVGESEFNTAFYIDMLENYAKANPSLSVENINSYIPNIIVQDELMRLEAEPLGITVDDGEVRKALEDAGQSATDADVTVVRTQQLETRLKDEYFGITVVPASADQVHILAMLVESDSVAIEARDRLLNGENFSTMVSEYAQDSYSKYSEGDLGWHPASILEDNLGSLIPVDYAFGAEPGDLSPPLSDNESSKSLGYWLIKVLDRPSDNETTVQALYLSSDEQAREIKARLEAGDDLAALADQYSQYTASKEKHGELGVMTRSGNTTKVVSTAFDEYVFNPDTELGKWSDPIADTQFSTKGGSWVVEVVEKEDNRPLSDDDRTYLIDKAYSDWINNIWLKYSADIDTSGLSDVLTWAINRANKELGLAGG
jgi:parvulin-like peptidyl-prolyl isomerase